MVRTPASICTRPHTTQRPAATLRTVVCVFVMAILSWCWRQMSGSVLSKQFSVFADEQIAALHLARHPVAEGRDHHEGVTALRSEQDKDRRFCAPGRIRLHLVERCTGRPRF